jgi:hypothetical protein
MHPYTHKELAGKLKAAMAAFEANRVAYVEKDMLPYEIDCLGLSGLEDYKHLLYECIQIALAAPKTCFQPPAQTSTRHHLTRGLPMWGFEVTGCEAFPTRRIYFKFSLKKTKSGQFYCHISCHESIKDPKKA